MTNSKLRGNPIYIDFNGEYRYSDDNQLTASNWKEKPCGHCLLPNRADEHDACLGELSGVINACCGHGNVNEAYIMFADKRTERGTAAEEVFQRMKG